VAIPFGYASRAFCAIIKLPVSAPPLKPLHDDASLNRVKLERFEKLATDALLDSLKPGQPGSLKTKADGTVMDGHHRLRALAGRGVDVNALARDVLASGEGEK
jgi:hypothetical protein